MVTVELPAFTEDVMLKAGRDANAIAARWCPVLMLGSSLAWIGDGARKIPLTRTLVSPSIQAVSTAPYIEPFA